MVFCHQDRKRCITGTLEVGKYADLVMFEKNPLDDIDAIQGVVSTYKEG